MKKRKIEISEMLKETLKKIENLFFSEKIPSPPQLNVVLKVLEF